jgi:hypothetical protein
MSSSQGLGTRGYWMGKRARMLEVALLLGAARGSNE